MDMNFIALLMFIAFVIWIIYSLATKALNKARNDDPNAPRERNQ